VFDDYLAFGGKTGDPGLLGSAIAAPYITLASISINHYYWTKAFK
jgi:hypothetical protein